MGDCKFERVLWYFVVHSVPDRTIGQKHMFYQSITGDYSPDGLVTANKLIDSVELDTPLDRLRSRWLNFDSKLGLAGQLSLRFTVCDETWPTEFSSFLPIAYYVMGAPLRSYDQVFLDYLELRAAHKSYGDIPHCFDIDRCWVPEVDSATMHFLKETQFDKVIKHLEASII